MLRPEKFTLPSLQRPALLTSERHGLNRFLLLRLGNGLTAVTYGLSFRRYFQFTVSEISERSIDRLRGIMCKYNQ